MRAEPDVPRPRDRPLRRHATGAAERASLRCCSRPCCCCFPARTLAAAKRPIRFERLSLEQGLSQSSANRILQDRRGYVWLATEDGLNRYDGIGFKVYRHDVSDAASLPASFVWDLAEDSAGNLWIATSGGLASWQRATDRIVRTETLAAQDMRALRLRAERRRALGRNARLGAVPPADRDAARSRASSTTRRSPRA